MATTQLHIPNAAKPIQTAQEHFSWGKETPLELIPQSTYRFQFHKGFTLQNAKSLLPYLSQLGITHCYASPLLQARPGSTHGYDIVNHRQINPEIGTNEDFQAFCDELKSHRMKLIVDIVPNHMGIGMDNQWWMDVLENGQASEFANYFDIDWTPLKPELRGKVLLPVLGSQYGSVLEKGELQLSFDSSTGKFFACYYDHSWPVNPNSYPLILNFQLNILEQTLGKDDLLFQEYQSIITALENLPSNIVISQDQLEIRWREKRVIHSRLIELCQKTRAIPAFIENTIATLNRYDDLETRSYLHNILEMQCYRLAFWRVASDEINYRRFFDINDLASLNMQNPEVFEATHELLFQWVKEGKVQGFRIDHPDGLYDPAGYFEQLQKKALEVLGQGENPEPALPLYLVVEKILAPHEQLPNGWPIHGTSGYEFGNRLMGLYVNSESEQSFSNIYQQFTGIQDNFEKQVYECKQLILKESLSSELNVLASKLYKISEQDWKTRDFTLNNLRRALGEVIAAFPVYRTYMTPNAQETGEINKKDVDYIQWAIRRAKKYSPLVDISIFDFIHQLLLMKTPDHADDHLTKRVIQFAMKFQQLTSPIMAKGLEDTCFYRYNRLTCLNEVGGEPNHFGLSVAAFHRKMQDQAKTFPHCMLNTSTHDSKRSEDVRARLAVLSEMPDVWEKQLEKWGRLNRIKKSDITTKPQGTEIPEELELAPDRNDEYLIYQTLLGAWPRDLHVNDEQKMAEFKERITQYILKACREAKIHSSWINQNTAYEDSVTKFIDALFAPENTVFRDDLLALQQIVDHFGALNSLSQTLIKLTVPGVPDIYQGNENWEFNLVDPDNRRPIRYHQLQEMLSKQAQYIQNREDIQLEKLKMFVTTHCLQYRREHPNLFTFGEYIPLQVEGSAANHLVAFIRQHQEQKVLVVAPRLLYTLNQGKPLAIAFDWKDSSIQLPENLKPAVIRNIMTDATVTCSSDKLPVSQLFETLPFGLFEIR